MAVLHIQTEPIRENIRRLDALISSRGAAWSLVTKLAAGHEELLETVLRDLPARALRSIGDSRAEHLAVAQRIRPGLPMWLIRPPAPQDAAEVVRIADLSCNTSMRTLRALEEAAAAAGTRHGVILMIETGELREGVPAEAAIERWMQISRMRHLDLVGLGTNLGCMRGIVPRRSHFRMLRELADRIAGAGGKRPEILSAGSSIALPLLTDSDPVEPGAHFRIGEAAFLGTTPLTGKRFRDLRADAFLFSCRILEIEEKEVPDDAGLAAAPSGYALDSPRSAENASCLRAVVDFGLVDVDPESLQPRLEGIRPAGVTSEMAVYTLPRDTNLRVGDCLEFRPDYRGTARLMNAPGIRKEIIR